MDDPYHQPLEEYLGGWNWRHVLAIIGAFVAMAFGSMGGLILYICIFPVVGEWLDKWFPEKKGN